MVPQEWRARPSVAWNLHLSSSDDDWLIIMREASDDTVIQAMSLSFKLRPGEADSAASAGR